MDSKSSKKPDIVDSVRNLAISRRGGVKTRGGRLPPISMREISQVTGSKRIVVPNIPQRRRIKQEIEFPTEPVIKTEPKDDFQNSRDRGRGRRPRTIIQTEGAFLADGPAAKTKKDPLAYESFSYSRLLRSSAAPENYDAKVEDEIIEDLLESPCLEIGAYEEFYGGKLPNQLPNPKKKMIPKFKEPDDDDGIKKKDDIVIKKEKADIDIVIKKEKDDDTIKEEKIKIKTEIKTEIDDDEFNHSKKKISSKKNFDSKTLEEENSAEEFLNLKGSDGKMILLQIPTHSSTPETEISEGSSKDKSKENETENEQISTFVDSLEEGFIGKLKILKSGRMKMVLGSVEFELIEGSFLESYWEAVSIRMREDGGDITVLNKIEKKMLLTPVMNMLLKKNQDIINKDMD